jgi:hypothetical protein
VSRLLLLLLLLLAVGPDAVTATGPACPRNTEWLVTSNGDNDYDPDFLATVVKQGQQADVVAFDYYSRFQRPTGEGCSQLVQFSAPIHTRVCGRSTLCVVRAGQLLLIGCSRKVAFC